MSVFVYNNFWEFFFSLKKCNSFLTLYDDPLRYRIGVIDSDGNEYYLPVKNMHASIINIDSYMEARAIFDMNAYTSDKLNNKLNDNINRLKNCFTTKDGRISVIKVLNEIYLSTDIGKMNEALR